ncbi:MAG: amidohydrolase [Wenzhouxiangella sp.]|nr:MAG: amidohydrolase [Wenzhouxiangella sp.]
MTQADPGNWRRLVEDCIAFRHELHAHPELTGAEFETAERIRRYLDHLEIPWRACAGTGTVADLASDAAGPCIAFRGDIDALPIVERNDLAYRSQTAGTMHACGHDGHTAALMATAIWFKQHEHILPGPVRLLFQPAEEGGHGARQMIEDGALEGVERIFGWHNWPALPYGQAACPDGPVMAGNGSFRITIHGRGGHGSQPELCRDPVLAGSAVVLALQQVVARRIAPQKGLVLSVCSFDARSAVTVIPERAVLEGSFRLAESTDRDLLTEFLLEVADNTARAYGTLAHVEVFPRYDATVNHPGPAADYRQALVDEFGEEVLAGDILLPVMASEDFSYYLAACPGAFALIGADDGGAHHNASLHRSDYDFNDALIARVTKLNARLAGAPLPPG